MNEQSIQEQYQNIIVLLEQKRLKEAQSQLEAFLWDMDDRSLVTAWSKRKHPTNICFDTCVKE